MIEYGGQELDYMMHVPLILRSGPDQDGCLECYILSDVNKIKIRYKTVNSLI